VGFKYRYVPAILYFLISISALIIVFISPSNMDLSGVGIVILTLPWSFIVVDVLDSMHLYSNLLRVILTIFSIIINTAILSFIFHYFNKTE
jgi:hypothetical protein